MSITVLHAIWHSYDLGTSSWRDPGKLQATSFLGEKKPLLVAFASVHAINTSTVAGFHLPKDITEHGAENVCKDIPSQSVSTIPILNNLKSTDCLKNQEVISF